LGVKLQIQTRVGFQHTLEYIRNFPLIAWHATSQGVRFIIGRYGVGLPFSAGNLYRSSGLGAPFLVFDIVVTALIFIYLDRAFQSSPSFQAVPKHAVKLILIGVLVFVLSYFPFSGNVNIDFLSTGPENRITIAAAIGAACVLIGLFAWIVSFCVPPKFQRRTYCCSVSLLMGLNLVCISALAKYWATAYASQRQILVRIQNDVSRLPTGGVLLLDGFCRYIGPAPVFETDWDSTGALQIVYGNETLSADVISSAANFQADRIVTMMYGQEEARHLYGSNLFLYDLRQGKTYLLSEYEEAQKYLNETSRTDLGCPPAREGAGAPVF